MPSSVTEEDVLEMRDARYLTGEISHRLPAQGQVIPTPEPGESVVFVSHFRRGLGFLTPFNNLRLHVEGFEPQAEVRGSAEEGFADDNE